MSSTTLAPNLTVYGISSYIKDDSIFNPKTFMLSKTNCLISRLYVKMSDILLPYDCDVIQANLYIPILSACNEKFARILVYSVDGPLNSGRISWSSFEGVPTTKIADTPISFPYVCVNLTSLIQRWVKNPESNHGILITCNEKAHNEINVNTNFTSTNGMRIVINCSRKDDCCYPKFHELIYDVNGTTANYCSPPVDISKFKVVSFYIRNLSTSPVKFYLQSSPDNISYMLSSEELILKGHEFNFLTPYFWSKYIRICGNSNSPIFARIFVQIQT